MKALKSAVALWLPVTLIALTSCSIHVNSARFKETRTVNVAHVAGSAVQVLADNGGIEIGTGDRQDVEIVADLRATTAERLAETRVVAERDTSSGRLNIQVQWPEGRKRNNEGCSFKITVPEANGVEARTSNGGVHVAGLSGNARLHSSNGAIEVQDQRGDVDCRTSNGSITVAGAEGAIGARTSNGRIEIRNAKHAVKAQSSNGAVHIDLADGGTGPVDAESSNGRMTLNVGGSFAGELELRTSNGAIQVSDLPDAKVVTAGKTHMMLRFGESPDRSRVTTSNGGIQIARSGSM
jgi:DUF4097 and DUF4098 domain-containing protein YvlB